MVSSASVPVRPEVVERDLSALTDEDIEHLSPVMARVWRNSSRIGTLGAFVPMGSCTGLAMFAPRGMEYAFGIGFLGLLLGSFISLIASKLYRRSLALEVESLGYDKGVIAAVERAYQRSIRKFIPRLTLRRKTATCRDELVRSRARGR